MGKIRINELARELEVKSNIVIQYLQEMGIEEKKSHSSALDDELADKVRAQAARHGGRFAVFMLDLDNFKTVNDLHGHGGGDRLLVELARRIQADLRDSDIVARFGGDVSPLVHPVVQRALKRKYGR